MDYKEIVESVGSYWDDRASTFDKDHDTEDQDAWKSLLAELVGDGEKPQTVLDLGAGTGFLANMLAELGHNVIGIDISEGMMRYGVRHAKAQGVPVFYMTGDAIDLPFLDNSVDIIVNARLIWTIAEPERMLKEWLRVLKPGGKILCFNRMKDDYGLQTWKYPSYDNEEIHKKLTFVDSSFEELCSALDEAGYASIECRRLPGELTRAEFDYDNWYVLEGSKPKDKVLSDEEGMAAYWDSSSETYDERHDLHDEAHWVEVLSGMIGQDRNLSILDVATGTAIIPNFLASAGYNNITGVDISEKMMHEGMRRCERLGNTMEFRYGNTLDLPFEDETFDVVMNSRLLWTLTDAEGAAAEWYRVLKPGGKLVAINELEDSGIEVDTDGWSYSASTGIDTFPFARVSREEIIKTLEGQSFKDVKVESMPGCHMKSSECENWFAFVGLK